MLNDKSLLFRILRSNSLKRASLEFPMVEWLGNVY